MNLLPISGEHVKGCIDAERGSRILIENRASTGLINIDVRDNGNGLEMHSASLFWNVVELGRRATLSDGVIDFLLFPIRVKLWYLFKAFFLFASPFTSQHLSFCIAWRLKHQYELGFSLVFSGLFSGNALP